MFGIQWDGGAWLCSTTLYSRQPEQRRQATFTESRNRSGRSLSAQEIRMGPGQALKKKYLACPETLI